MRAKKLGFERTRDVKEGLRIGTYNIKNIDIGNILILRVKINITYIDDTSDKRERVDPGTLFKVLEINCNNNEYNMSLKNLKNDKIAMICIDHNSLIHFFKKR
jgi:hypothetical protein